jgi:threonylcarbamoyladenosine tRNA methylthiotransferase MtaB
MRVFLSHVGCKLNQAEVDAIARQFLARGHQVVSSLALADVHVVNSCTVTREAARDSRRAARRAARAGRPLRTVLTGCYATSSAAEAAALGVDLVVPNPDKERLVELVARAARGWDAPAGGSTAAADAAVPVSYVPLALGNARALVKIEDGCDLRCAFCIIPRTRGAQRSRPLAEVVAEVCALEGAGHREIVVTGVQISAYRDGGARLPELLDALLVATTHCRFRLTSIAPWELAPALLDRIDHPRVCRHLHLSLQSGDHGVLRRMRRPYDPARYAAAVESVRSRIPGVAITTDVIVGFPGETDAEFESSLAFVEAIGFARVHAFTYSPREGTAAAAMADQVPAGRKRERMTRLLGVAARAEETFRARHVGAEAHVLWEGRRAGRWAGTSDDYLRVFTESDRDLRGRLTTARLVELLPNGLLAAPGEHAAGRQSAPS